MIHFLFLLILSFLTLIYAILKYLRLFVNFISMHPDCMFINVSLKSIKYKILRTTIIYKLPYFLN